MAWFYKYGSEQMGPVDKAQLQQLINDRKVDGKTMVRDESADNWRPLAELIRKKDDSSTESGHSEVPPPAPGPVESQKKMICSQCGGSFSEDQVVSFDGQTICANCKPMFIQRLKEGVAAPGVLEYAGFWIRVGAKLIDGVILAIVQYALMIPLGIVAFSMNQDSGEMVSWGFLALQQLLGIAIPAGYNTFFIGRFGATLGKMACQIKVVTPEGDPVSYSRALGRYFGELISAILLCIGYFMVAFDNEKRGLHDRICSTRVVHK